MGRWGDGVACGGGRGCVQWKCARDSDKDLGHSVRQLVSAPVSQLAHGRVSEEGAHVMLRLMSSKCFHHHEIIGFRNVIKV